MKSRFSADNSVTFSTNGNQKDIIETKKRGATAKKDRLGKNTKKRAIKAGGGSPTAKLVTELEKSINKPVKCSGKDWYTYEGGKWNKSKRDYFKPLVLEIQELGNTNVLTAERVLHQFEFKHQMKEGEEFVSAINHNVMISGAGYYLLNFPNGTLRISLTTGKIVERLEHRAEHMFTATMGDDCDNEDEGTDCELFKQTLTQVLPRQSDRILLLDFFTSALLPHSHYQCALFCIGNGANGKSIITEALAGAFGDDVRSAVKLHHICGGDRGKHVWQLEKKLLNVSTETENRVIEDNSDFKSIVSGEKFAVARLYEHGYTMQSNVKLVSCSNHLPMFKYGTDAEDRRVRIIHFSQKFDGENSDLMLAEKLAIERKGILNYLIRRLPKVCRLGEMSKGSFVSQKVMKEFKTNNNIVTTFFNQCLELVTTSSVNKDLMYRVFRQFSYDREDRCRLTRNQFFSQVRKLYPALNTRYKVKLAEKVVTISCKGVQFSDFGIDLWNLSKQNLRRKVVKNVSCGNFS